MGKRSVALVVGALGAVASPSADPLDGVASPVAFGPWDDATSDEGNEGGGGGDGGPGRGAYLTILAAGAVGLVCGVLALRRR